MAAAIFPLRGIAGDLSVHIDFSGGSAAVETIDQEKRMIRFMPSEHSNRGWRCWWYFRLEGLEAGESLTLDLGDAPWATPDRATFSDDGQKTWHHTAPGKREGRRIVYQFTAKKSGDHWFAWGPPFVLKDAQWLVERAVHASGPSARMAVLAKSRDGHLVPAIQFSDFKSPGPKFGIWIHARQHAWESGSSWVCRGLIEWLVSKESLELRKRADLFVVPLMDVDNVERGAGGKNQNPWDHNRDWREKPHWPEVTAAQEGILTMQKGGRFDLFIDLHNPGANDKEAFYYIPPRNQLSETGRKNLETFAAFSKECITGPIPFKGKLIESGPNYDPKNWKYISKNWVARNTNDSAVAVTLETPWNAPGSHPEGYLTVGRQLGQAIQKYVEELGTAQEN